MTSSSGVLNIVSAECSPARIDFIMSVAHNLASRNYTENIIVKLQSDSGHQGFGECIPRKYVTGETTKSVLEILTDSLSLLQDISFASPEEVLTFLEDFGKSPIGECNPAAVCAMELALLDLAGKFWNIPVTDILGLEFSDEPLIYSLVVPLLPDEALHRFLIQAKNFGFENVKIKVDSHNPTARVIRVKEILGGAIEIRVDANCAWNRNNAPAFMEELANLGVISVEEPLSSNDLEGCADLRNKGLMLITLDESASSISAVDCITELGACDVINVKISKCGGLIKSKHIINTVLRRGLKVQLGAHVGESCILTAAGACLASGTPAFLWREGCFGKYLLKKDFCIDEFQFSEGGRFFPPKNPGLGITIDTNLVEEAISRS